MEPTQTVQSRKWLDWHVVLLTSISETVGIPINPQVLLSGRRKNRYYLSKLDEGLVSVSVCLWPALPCDNARIYSNTRATPDSIRALSESAW